MTAERGVELTRVRVASAMTAHRRGETKLVTVGAVVTAERSVEAVKVRVATAMIAD